ncbi:MAG: hypothetical protein B6D62_01860 [Candidatus Cloacimonas sp. 4484_275]|nr:MAG: hypothetical protein B6D62_01860 [Candidatus Cloacimonas sp. 4484_275]
MSGKNGKMVEKKKKEMVEKSSASVKEKKVLNLLHLARKAGKLQIGFDACERSCLRNRAKLVIFAEDISKNNRRRILFVAKNSNTKAIAFGTKLLFGEAFKAKEIGIICVEDENFVKGLIPLLTESKGE